MTRFIFGLIIILFSGITLPNEEENNLKVEVIGLRNSVGQIGLRLFKNKEGFPSDDEKAFKQYFFNIKDGKASFVIKGIEFGVYAIGSIHDENSNNKFDKNFIGYPKEGFGASNNPTVFLSPPSFDESKFKFSKNDTLITIKMKYF